MKIYSISEEKSFSLDLNEMPADYHYLKVYCLRDRDIKENMQVQISYRDEVLYHSSNIDDYEMICEKIKDKKYCLTVVEDNLCLFLK